MQHSGTRRKQRAGRAKPKITATRTPDGKREKTSELSEPAAAETDPNPAYGNRGEFRKITITLPPETYEQLVSESARRKIAGKPNHLLSSLMREALVSYLDDLRRQSGTLSKSAVTDAQVRER